MAVTSTSDGDLAVIEFANTALNILSDTVRIDLIEAFDRAIAASDVRAIVLCSAGDNFCTGQSPTNTAPSLMDLCTRVESSPKPVVVALQGAVFGDGLDLAAACHFRLGGHGVQIGAPAIRLGLPPRGGITQRLPRICGAGSALGLLLGGTPRAPMAEFLDAAPSDDLRAATRDFARAQTAARPTADRIERLHDPASYMAAISKARGAVQGSPIEAPARIVACIEGAMVLPFDTGLAMEQAAYDDCAVSPAAIALAALARAEIEAWTFPQAVGGTAQPLDQVAIVGGTSRAGELALSCLDAGLRVMLVELDPSGQAAVLERLLALYDDAVGRGALAATGRDARLLRIQPDAVFDDLARADVVWEAAPEDETLRREMWSAIALLARPGALLVMSGDTLAPQDLIEAKDRLPDTVGLHIPGAAHTGTLVELCLPAEVRPDIAASALSLTRILGRQAVRAADQSARLVHHLRETLQRTIEALIIGGHPAVDIDVALMEYGFRQGPCAEMDGRGLEQVLTHRRTIRGESEPQLSLLDALVDIGFTGRAAGAGLLLWQGDRPEGEPEEMRALCQALAEAGVAAIREVRSPQIAPLCAAALADAGAKLFDAGLIDRLADVDVAAVYALGFPRWRGGPMIAADQRSLMRVEREIASLMPKTVPSPSFAHCIKNGLKIANLKRE